MSSVIVIDYISPMIRTGDVDRIRYCGSGIVCVLETQDSGFLNCCVGYVEGKAKKRLSFHVGFI